MSFIPLHIYSGYSFLRSGLSLKRIVSLGLKRGYSHIGLSDYQTMTGFPELFHLTQNRQIVPVFGMDIQVEGNLFSCYVASEQGYRNLIVLSHLASKGSVSIEDFLSHAEGLEVVLVSESSFVYAQQNEGIDALAERLQPLSKRIGNLRIGLPYLPRDPHFVAFLRSFCAKYPYTLIAFPHILYQNEDDAITLRIVEAINADEHLEESEARGDNYFLEQETIASYYHKDEMDACEELVSKLNFNFILKRGSLLHFPNDEGITSEEYLRKKAYEGLKKRNPGYSKEYQDRLEYELSVIHQMGYDDYFLVVADYIDHAREVGISVGPSRGSAAGSLVAYALNIVFLDPLKYGLLFERFLNPKRQSMPDIDVDFTDIRRDEIVTYLQQKYGKSRVSHIVTMQTLGAKGSIRDIGRVYNKPQHEIKLLAESVEFDDMTLGQNYKRSAKFKELVDSDPYYRQYVSLASKIEGLPRQAGLHAAGVILNDGPLEGAVPVSENPDGTLVCQYEMSYLEEQGFLKMDLLSLRNLTIIERCLDTIERVYGKRIPYQSIPYEDEESIKLIASGKVMGLFQLESPGMRRAIMEVGPTSFEDIVSILALYRPGPMDFIHSFAQRKKGRERILYPVKELERILAPTYGIIVYQEQIMQIVSTMAGFDFGQADLFRRAISKKDEAKLVSLKGSFMEGCRKKGYTEADGEKVFDLILKFANYGFAKAHACGYAVITCQMAYLKRHACLAFYSAILDEVTSSDSKFSRISMEIKQEKIRLLLPDINASGLRYSPEKNRAIRFPLSAISGVPGKLLIDLIEERNLNGNYQDIFDFALRNKKNGLKLENLIRLIDAGCFDSINPHRASLRLSAASAISYAELFTGDSGNGILLDLEFPKPSLKAIEDTPLEDLQAEKAALGVMLSGSPLDQKKDVIAQKKLVSLQEAMDAKYACDCAAVVRSVKTITTKKGTKLAFLSIYDQSTEAEATVFASALQEAYPYLKEGELIQLNLRRDSFKEGTYVATQIKPL